MIPIDDEPPKPQLPRPSRLATEALAPSGQAHYRHPGSGINVAVEYTNTDQNLIHITEDRAHRRIKEHLERLSNAKDWQPYLGLLLAFLAPLFTAEFKKVVLPAETWMALFVFGAIWSACRLAQSLYYVWKAPTVDALVHRLKSNDP